MILNPLCSRRCFYSALYGRKLVSFWDKITSGNGSNLLPEVREKTIMLLVAFQGVGLSEMFFQRNYPVSEVQAIVEASVAAALLE